MFYLKMVILQLYTSTVQTCAQQFNWNNASAFTASNSHPIQSSWMLAEVITSYELNSFTAAINSQGLTR